MSAFHGWFFLGWLFLAGTAAAANNGTLLFLENT